MTDVVGCGAQPMVPILVFDAHLQEKISVEIHQRSGEEKDLGVRPEPPIRSTTLQQISLCTTSTQTSCCPISCDTPRIATVVPTYFYSFLLVTAAISSA